MATRTARTKLKGFGSNYCTANSVFRSAVVNGPAGQFIQVCVPRNSLITAETVFNLSNCYQYFRIKSFTVRIVSLLPMTQACIMTACYLYDSEAMNLFLAASVGTRDAAIRSNASAKAFSVNDPKARWDFNVNNTSGRRWWRCDQTSDPSVPALEQTAPGLFGAQLAGTVGDTDPVCFLKLMQRMNLRTCFRESLEMHSLDHCLRMHLGRLVTSLRRSPRRSQLFPPLRM